MEFRAAVTSLPRQIPPPRVLWAALALMVLWLALGVPRVAYASTDDFLPPEKAFPMTARAVQPDAIELRFDIEPGYYLYREQFKFSAEGASLRQVQLPAGEVKFDETFQKDVETYRGVLRILVPVTSAAPRFEMVVTWQGCADKGLCYPPQEQPVAAQLAAFGGDGTARALAVRDPFGPSAVAQGGGAAAPAAGLSAAGDTGAIEAALRSGRFWWVVAAFFGAGLLLSLTPCVLPMLPILSSIIVGQAQGSPGSNGAAAAPSRLRGLSLAASYSLGMAVIYTLLGVAAGLAGEGLAAWLQNPWVLGAFALMLVTLALSMFGAYELQMPSALASRLNAASGGLPGGRLLPVFAMGGISALIVSPCVAAPLAGALLYISQTRDVALGGTALFALAVGMSVPLLALGASAGAWLPRAGAWMDDIKRLFGLALLGVALWIVQSLLPEAVVLAAWGTLLIAAAVLLFEMHTAPGHAGASRRLARHALAATLGVLGLLQLVGAASGGRDPLQPLAHLAARGAGAASAATAAPTFRPVRTVAELDQALAAAGRPVMLDFYADWCVSCKEMERFTFSDQRIAARMREAVLLKADVTRNTPEDRALLKRFDLFGPPGIVFFDANGREVAGTRVVGYQDATRFGQTLDRAGL